MSDERHDDPGELHHYCEENYNLDSEPFSETERRIQHELAEDHAAWRQRMFLTPAPDPERAVLWLARAFVLYRDGLLDREERAHMDEAIRQAGGLH